MGKRDKFPEGGGPTPEEVRSTIDDINANLETADVKQLREYKNSLKGLKQKGNKEITGLINKINKRIEDLRPESESLAGGDGDPSSFDQGNSLDEKKAEVTRVVEALRRRESEVAKEEATESKPRVEANLVNVETLKEMDLNELAEMLANAEKDLKEEGDPENKKIIEQNIELIRDAFYGSAVEGLDVFDDAPKNTENESDQGENLDKEWEEGQVRLEKEREDRAQAEKKKNLLERFENFKDRKDVTSQFDLLETEEIEKIAKEAEDLKAEFEILSAEDQYRTEHISRLKDIIDRCSSQITYRELRDRFTTSSEDMGLAEIETMVRFDLSAKGVEEDEIRNTAKRFYEEREERIERGRREVLGFGSPQDVDPENDTPVVGSAPSTEPAKDPSYFSKENLESIPLEKEKKPGFWDELGEKVRTSVGSKLKVWGNGAFYDYFNGRASKQEGSLDEIDKQIEYVESQLGGKMVDGITAKQENRLQKERSSLLNKREKIQDRLEKRSGKRDYFHGKMTVVAEKASVRMREKMVPYEEKLRDLDEKQKNLGLDIEARKKVRAKIEEEQKAIKAEYDQLPRKSFRIRQYFNARMREYNKSIGELEKKIQMLSYEKNSIAMKITGTKGKLNSWQTLEKDLLRSADRKPKAFNMGERFSAERGRTTPDANTDFVRNGDGYEAGSRREESSYSNPETRGEFLDTGHFIDTWNSFNSNFYIDKESFEEFVREEGVSYDSPREGYLRALLERYFEERRGDEGYSKSDINRIKESIKEAFDGKRLRKYYFNK